MKELNRKMREAGTVRHEEKLKVGSEWPIFRVHHKRSRYICDLYFKRKVISKWKKQIFENLCCLLYNQGRDTNFGTSYVCRVTKSRLEEEKGMKCQNCGCRSCSGSSHL
ncbi:unnamed protein product [Mesocestoides corti]|uniref:Zf-3CxxC domain-containing protein n=1 Tax=Mesocestoides corti TaxID=53468 RepID=A0A0R3UN44_MESCO|nr:unnamed protein product [Mesocestoides corti]